MLTFKDIVKDPEVVVLVEEADRQRNRVYQINMQLFPLSKSFGERG